MTVSVSWLVFIVLWTGPQFVGAQSMTTLASQQGQAGSSRSEPEEVVLDGAKNPELFPEWFVWEHTFQAISENDTNRKVPLHQELGVTEAEVTILLAEVRAFKQLEVTLDKRLRDTRAAAVADHKTEDQIRDATQVVNLDYRYKVLEARQRVYERLSPESMMRLRTWINQLIQATEVRLRGRAIKFFRQPW